MTASLGGAQEAASLEVAQGPDDRVLPFQVDALDLRGRVVTLGPSLDIILERHDFPRPVKLVLAEAIVLTALLASSIKNADRLILQTQSDGPVSMLVVDIRSPGHIRATATFDTDAFAQRGENVPTDRLALLGSGSLAMTIEQGEGGQRYQGYVELQGSSLEDTAHAYFQQSEQTPTCIRMAVAEVLDRDENGAPRHRWRGGGLIAQFLPESTSRIPHRDLAAGDLPEGVMPETDFSEDDDDAWVEATSLVGTVEDDELTDPEIPAERLLTRLFHERGVTVFSQSQLEERCTCSSERIETVLAQMGRGELEESAENGVIEVRCEFCGLVYEIDVDEIPDAQGEDDTDSAYSDEDDKNGPHSP